MRLMAFLLGGLLAISSFSRLGAGETARVSNCVIYPEEEVRVPAQEQGMLVELPVGDGASVKNGDLLARIDDAIPTAQFNVATAKLKAAEAEANSTVTKRYAEAAAEHAKADYKVNWEANNKLQGTITDVALDEKRLKWVEMTLMIEKAVKDLDVAKCQAAVAKAELEAAAVNRAHRRITAVIDNAQVIEVNKHVGEWVQAGDTLMRLVRMDVLRVEGFIDATSYLPWELQNQPVTVTVPLAHGRQETFPGKVVFVSPMVGAGKLQIRAEVQNRKENEAWVLLPGLDGAEMDIQVK